MSIEYIKVKKYLQKYIELTENDIQCFFELIEFKTVYKNEIILDFYKKCKYQFFILDGLLISYDCNDVGENKVIQISVENSWTGDLNSFISDKPSTRMIKSYEKSNLILLKKENWEKLLSVNFKFEKLFRIIFQNAYIQQTKRLEANMKYDTKTRLEIFLNENPLIIMKVQKKIIASYLDMTPETLSRLLKKHFT